MDIHTHPHLHPYQHPVGLKKRTYRDEDVLNNNNETVTLIGNELTSVESHRYSVNAQNDHQRRRMSQAHPIDYPLDPFLLAGEEYCLEDFPQTPCQGSIERTIPRAFGSTLYSSSPQPSSFDFDPSCDSINHTQQQSLTFLNVPSFLPNMRLNGRRHRRPQHSHVEESIDSGSEDSKTLNGSQSLSRTTSFGGVQDFVFNAPNDVSHSSVFGSSHSYPVTGDLEETVTIEGRSTLPTHDQYGDNPDSWQHPESQPWSEFNTNNRQKTVSHQHASLCPIAEDMFYKPPAVFLSESIDMYALNPSETSNESFHVPNTSGKFFIHDCSSVYQNHECKDFAGLGSPFYDDQGIGGSQRHGQGDIGSTGAGLDIHNQQSPYSEASCLSGSVSRTLPLLRGDSSVSDPFVTQASIKILYTTNPTPANIQPNILEDTSRLVSDYEVEHSRATIEHKWENMTVHDGAIQTLGSKTPPSGTIEIKSGGRKYPLSLEARYKARDIRRRGACLRCSVLHIPCDLEEKCDNCSRLRSPYSSRICIRILLHEHTPLLFPERLALRHKKSQADIIKDNVKHFAHKEIEVELSSGPQYPPIKLTVYEFAPRNDDFLFLWHSSPNATSPSSVPLKVYGPPIGLSGSKIKHEIITECKNHINGMIKHDRFPKDATNGDAAPVSKMIFSVINYYRNSKSENGKDELIKKATQLLAMHFFMRKIISFTQDSAKKAVDNLEQPMRLLYELRPSSKLLNTQIKRELHFLQVDLTHEILQKLLVKLQEKRLHLWVTCFSVLLILCMCIEAVQLSIDGFIVQRLTTNDSTHESESREAGFRESRHLEDLLFGDLVDTFHLIYRSGKFKKFHPVRDGANAENFRDLDRSSIHFINEVHRIVMKNHDHLQMKAAKNPTWGEEENLLVDHYRFRRENSGRLVAKFLLSCL